MVHIVATTTTLIKLAPKTIYKLDPTCLIKKGGGGQKLPILRRNSLWIILQPTSQFATFQVSETFAFQMVRISLVTIRRFPSNF